jgi:O-antigen/teichoic acid export membrane protein
MANEHTKDVFSQTLIYGVGLFANKFISFLLIPIYTYFFAPSDMGFYNIASSIWLVIAIVYVYGTETSFIKFFTDEKTKDKKSEVYSSTLLMILFSSIVFSAVIYLLSGTISGLVRFDNYESGKKVIKIISVLLFIDTLNRFPMLLLRAELNAKKYLIISLTAVVMNLLFNLLFIVILHKGVESIFYSLILADIISFSIGFAITSEYFKIFFSKETALRLLSFGNKFIFIGIFILFIDVSDRFFLKYFTDEATVGIYSTNYRLASAMGLIISAFKFSWTPYFLNIADNPDNKNIISDIFTKYIFAGALLFLIFGIFTEPLVTMKINGLSLLNEKYYNGTYIIPIIILSYFFSGLVSNMEVAPFFTNKTYFLLIVTAFGTLVDIAFNLILIPHFQMAGAAWATTLSYGFMFILIYILSQRVYRINYNWFTILKIAVITTLIYLIYIFIKNNFAFDPISRIITGLILIGITFLLFRFLRIADIKSIIRFFIKS